MKLTSMSLLAIGFLLLSVAQGLALFFQVQPVQAKLSAQGGIGRRFVAAG